MSEEPTKNLSGGDLGRILARLDSIDARLGGMEKRLDHMDKRLDNMDTRLEKLEARAYDTKPIWERALAELLEISKRLESLDRRFSVLNDDVIHTRADVRRLEERMTNLEEPSRA
jgi:chromosome segregation ATPase